MSPSPQIKLKEFARRLLAYEKATNKLAPDDSAVFGVCHKLRDSLGKLMGSGGFRALLSRALMVAGAEVPWLRTLRIEGDGSLKGLEDAETKLGAKEVANGEVVLVAALLDLLITFIGPALTRRLLRDSWPELDDLEF